MRTVLLGGVLGLLHAAAVLAASPGGEMPEALKGIAPAGASCQRDDRPAASSTASSSGAGSGSGDPAPAADLSCALAAAEAHRRLGQAQWMVIDTRPADVHQLGHVAGALNLSASQLRSKAFLRDRTLVLMGSGRGDEALYAACADLKQRGFSRIRVMQGGWAEWIAQGLPVVAPTRPAPVPPLTTAELWLESEFEANLVLAAPSHATLQAHLPHAKLLKDLTPATLRQWLAQRRKAMKDAPLHAVVIAADASTLTPALEQSLREAIPVPLMIYSKSADTFVREMRQQQLSWRAYARGPKLPPCGR